MVQRHKSAGDQAAQAVPEQDQWQAGKSLAGVVHHFGQVIEQRCAGGQRAAFAG